MDSPLPKEWHSINVEGFEKVCWTYSQNYAGHNCVCNGIVIPLQYSYERYYGINSWSNFRLINRYPNINIFDYAGNFPVSLNRNSLTENIPFKKQLDLDILKDLIAYILTIPESGISKAYDDKIIIQDQTLHHPSLWLPTNDYTYKDYFFSSISELLICKKGYTINHTYFTDQLKDARVLLINTKDYKKNSTITIDIENYFFKISYAKLTSIRDYRDAIEIKSMYRNMDMRVIMSKKQYEYIFKSNVKRIGAMFKMKAQIEFEFGDYISLIFDQPPTNTNFLDFVIQNIKNINFARDYQLIKSQDNKYESSIDIEISKQFDFDPIGEKTNADNEYNPEEQEDEEEFNVNKAERESDFYEEYKYQQEILISLLQRYIGKNAVIPYSLDERKSKYPLAFRELKVYMKKYLS